MSSHLAIEIIGRRDRRSWFRAFVATLVVIAIPVVSIGLSCALLQLLVCIVARYAR